MKKPLIVWLMLVLIAGCASKPEVPPKEDLAPFDTGEIEYPSTQPVDGSIFTPGQNSMMIGLGKRYNVGDIVIVRMDEAIDAEDSIESSASHSTSASGGFGVSMPVFSTEDAGSISFNSDKAIDGSGSSSQSHRLEGNIATTVTRIFPNGTLEVKGYKEITLERGTEIIAITGRIREQDISTADNSVASNQLAGAKIYYRGSGHVYDKSEGSILSEIVTSPYWPF